MLKKHLAVAYHCLVVQWRRSDWFAKAIYIVPCIVLALLNTWLYKLQSETVLPLFMLLILEPLVHQSCDSNCSCHQYKRISEADGIPDLGHVWKSIEYIYTNAAATIPLIEDSTINPHRQRIMACYTYVLQGSVTYPASCNQFMPRQQPQSQRRRRRIYICSSHTWLMREMSNSSLMTAYKVSSIQSSQYYNTVRPLTAQNVHGTYQRNSVELFDHSLHSH